MRPTMTDIDKQSERSSRAPKSAARAMRLAYLTTEYPKVSHTFIRRELTELERRGHVVERWAIRSPGNAIADPSDREELNKTFHCLKQSAVTLAGNAAGVLLTRPIKFLKAVRVARQLHKRSPRGFVRHVAYLIEACTLLNEAKKKNIEHVHVHFGTNCAAVALLMRELGGPTFSFTVHGPDEFDDPVGHSLDIKAASASTVIAITDFCSAQLRRWLRYEDWQKVHVVHCTVDEKFFDEHRPVDTKSRTLISIGRLSAQKGQLLLIEALARLVEEGIDVKVVLGGDGEMRDVIERRIRELKVHDRVEITGWISEAEVRKQLLTSRGLVLPSFAEGLPVVIMEALAMGRPVISTAVAGIPELVQTGETGWLVSAGSVDQLVDAMRAMMETPAAQLNELGENGRRLVRERHQAATEAAKLEAIFENIISGDKHA